MNTLQGEVICRLKPVISELIQFYCKLPENSAGGNLHIVLSDGNLEEGFLSFGQDQCQNYDDHLGYLIAAVLRCFSAEEREQMYEEGWAKCSP